MPVKIDPGLIRGPGKIGDWRPAPRLVDLLKNNSEKEALKVEKNPVKMKHAKVTPPKDMRDGQFSSDDPLIKVRMKKTIPAAPDRIHTQELEKGKVYEIPESMARHYFEKGFAVKVKEIKKGDKK